MKNSKFTKSSFIGLLAGSFLLGSSLVVPTQVLAVDNTRGWSPKKTTSKPAAKSTTPTKSTSQSPAQKAAPQAKSVPTQSKSAIPSVSQKQLSDALALARNGQYDQAAIRLFALSRRPELQAERMQIKYILGVCLMELKLNQIAVFQFVDVIRNGASKYTKQAIEKLSIAADELGDDTLLNYAVSKVQLEDFPEKNKDMIYYRLGEIKIKNGQYQDAAQSFARVGQKSRYSAQAKFNRGRALLEAKQPDEALKSFQDLLALRAQAPVTDTNKVAAELAIARTYYQAQKWDEAIEWYRKIPRDTDFWHQSLFEQSWAYLRAAKFRSVLSNFQSLHSSYYEEYYIPESLLLRSIVYLYICKYDEMDKVLDLFERTYGPVRSQLGAFLQNNKEASNYFLEIEKSNQFRMSSKATEINKTYPGKIPYSVARHILDQGDVKRAFGYLKYLNDEKRKLDSSHVLNKGSFVGYANKILANRMKNTKISIGEMVRSHMANVRVELKDLYEQAGFVRYEMINGKKEQLKKKIAGKDLSNSQIDEDVNREFYIQNGYEYWPFDGEYWLDEVGNYHYLGKQSCE